MKPKASKSNSKVIFFSYYKKALNVHCRNLGKHRKVKIYKQKTLLNPKVELLIANIIFFPIFFCCKYYHKWAHILQLLNGGIRLSPPNITKSETTILYLHLMCHNSTYEVFLPKNIET